MKTEYKVLVNGKLLASSNGETTEVINPANGKVMGLAPKCTPTEIDEAVAAAKKTQHFAWKNIQG